MVCNTCAPATSLYHVVNATANCEQHARRGMQRIRVSRGQRFKGSESLSVQGL